MSDDRYDLPPNDPDQRPSYRRARGVIPNTSGITPEDRIRRLCHRAGGSTLEDALAALRALPFSRRRCALDTIDHALRDRTDYRTAWPDALQFLSADLVWLAIDSAANNREA